VASPAETSGPQAASALRCAIYTRKSTEEGLGQEFNSLDAQRECAEAYILSQRQEGWTVLPQRYDDGGFTGANLERPALRRLLADIQTVPDKTRHPSGVRSFNPRCPAGSDTA